MSFCLLMTSVICQLEPSKITVVRHPGPGGVIVRFCRLIHYTFTRWFCLL